MAAKAPTAKRAKRLLGLLSHLRPGTTIPLADLAAAVGTSEAEVAEDLQTLSMCGVHPYDPYDLVDVFLEDGLVHVYSEPPALSEPARLTSAELQAISAALRACGFGRDDGLLAKVESAASPSATPDDVARLVRTHSTDATIASAYAALARAIEDREKVEADYLASGTPEPTHRLLRPLSLAWWAGAWYLSAYCESAREQRTFRVDRFLAVSPTGETFEPGAHDAARVPAFDAQALPAAIVAFAPGEHVSATDWPGASFEPARDGGTIARVPYSSVRWIARSVASRSGTARVLEPDEVREAVLRLAEEELDALGEPGRGQG